MHSDPSCQTARVLRHPRVEGVVIVGGGRRLGFAEFGQPGGRPVIWMHGTPGARRQIPQAARMAAEEFNLRLIGLDRPGVGHSTPHLYENIAGFTDDMAGVLDDLGIDRFAMLGLSGGGPYVLACAAALPDRMMAAGVLGGVAPTMGPDAAAGGIVSLAARFAPVLSGLRVPLSWLLMTFLWTARPAAQPLLATYARLSPEGDRRLFARPEMRAMFIDDLLTGGRPGLRAPVYDVVLFGRDWGFRLGDVKIPVHWWHGDADHIVPFAHGQHCVGLLPNAHLHVLAGESHLGSLGVAEDILGSLMRTWDERIGIAQ